MPEDRAVAVRRRLRCALLFALAALPASANAQEGDARLSKDMRQAIDMYGKGDDLGAMDRFMEILVKGDPAERSLANDYLNRITHRMATGSKLENPPPPAEEEPAAPASAGGPEQGVSPRAPVETVTPEGPPAPAVSVEGGVAPPETPAEAAPSDREEPAPPRSQGGPSEDRKAMKEEIDARIRARTSDALGHLRRWEDIQVRMANSRLPRAIGFKSSLLFDDGMKFKKDAGRILDALSDLVFSLGATQVVILPEGALVNEAKILDMRRTMAISAQLMKAGVSPSRLRVNLLNSQVDIPPDLRDWRGVMLVFLYNQPLNLASDSDVGAEAGPPVSLGVSPGTLDPRENEGVIIELSVMEPPAGLASWRFQLLGPGTKPDSDMTVLQEVHGSAPVFHQIYWNARKRYFGDALPGGRYQCVLTATDARNRTARERAWLEVKGAPPPQAPAAAAVARAPQVASADVDMRPVKGEDDELEPSVKTGPRKSAKKKRTRSRGRKGKPARVKRKAEAAPAVASTEIKPGGAAASTPDATSAEASAPGAVSSGTAPATGAGAPPTEGAAPNAAAGGDDASPRAGAVNYQVLFERNTLNITKEGDGILTSVASTMRYYPLDNIHLVGYAYNGEPDAATLASRRAELVSKLLVEQHGMKAEHIRTDTKVVDFEAFKVEIYIVEGAQ